MPVGWGHQFPKTLEEFAVRTENGGIATLVGVAVCAVLLLTQWYEFFFTRSALEEVIVDTGTLHETLSINFDITFMKMPCPKVSYVRVRRAAFRGRNIRIS